MALKSRLWIFGVLSTFQIKMLIEKTPVLGDREAITGSIEDPEM